MCSNSTTTSSVPTKSNSVLRRNFSNGVKKVFNTYFWMLSLRDVDKSYIKQRELSKSITIDLLFTFSYNMRDCIVMSCGMTFWRNSYHSIRMFRWQKRIIRIIMGRGNRDCCRNLFIKLNIFTLMPKYILSLLIHIQLAAEINSW
jgi:hypothetical protein